MKLYNVKKILFITLLAVISSVQLEAMSLRQLIVIMFICSPGTGTVAQPYIKAKIKYNIKNNDLITRNRIVRSPDDGALFLKYPPLTLSADLRNKNRFGTEYPATERPVKRLNDLSRIKNNK